MARLAATKDFSHILIAAKTWSEKCLVNDGSILSEASLWTPVNVETVKRAFVDNPDERSDVDFYTKLKGQLDESPKAAKQLMSEMLWILFLFPSNMYPQTKREQIQDIWETSGSPLPASPFLADQVLSGVGSGGPAFHALRWMELEYLIRLVGYIKGRDLTERQQATSDYRSFLDWISTVPARGNRQFPLVLRYLLFPDFVERMSSNNHRRVILEKFGVANKRITRKWDDLQLDEALLKIRQKWEAEHPGRNLDFYEPPLRAVWVSEVVDNSVPVLPPVAESVFSLSAFEPL